MKVYVVKVECGNEYDSYVYTFGIYDELAVAEYECIEAMERYVKAREEYENFKMVQDEEMAHIEHEQELRERENGETY